MRRCVNYLSQTFISGQHTSAKNSFNTSKQNLRGSPSEIGVESKIESKDKSQDESKAAFAVGNSSSGAIVGIKKTRKDNGNTDDKPDVKDAYLPALSVENQKKADSNIKEQTSIANEQRELEILRLQEKVLRLQEKISKLQKKVSTLQGVSSET